MYMIILYYQASYDKVSDHVKLEPSNMAQTSLLICPMIYSWYIYKYLDDIFTNTCIDIFTNMRMTYLQ